MHIVGGRDQGNSEEGIGLADVRLFLVDAFSSYPFGGNPAAVCLLPGPADEAWMQLLARELKLSETAFLYRQDERYSLRWFTPRTEVGLCGHATLASAHALWESGQLTERQPAVFLTQSGELQAHKRDEWVELDFPARDYWQAELPPLVTEALGITPTSVQTNGRSVYLLEVDSESAVRSMQPDFAALHNLPVRAVIVTARSLSEEYDFISRYFAPGLGIDEDPVTGSAHCYLGPYWRSRLGKDTFLAYQASERGGEVRVSVTGNRVFLQGQAVTVYSATLSAAAAHRSQ